MVKQTKNRFVFIDTETGGVVPTKHSLLSIGLVIWEHKIGILDSREFNIKYDEYVVTASAQRVNKFDEYNHDNIAHYPQRVIEDLINYLRIYFPDNMAIPLIGHNVQFDIAFLKNFFCRNGRSYEKYFSHRAIDTYSVYKTLVLAGLIESNLNSSTDAFRYFRIHVSDRHNALSDCLATVELYEKMLDMLEASL